MITNKEKVEFLLKEKEMARNEMYIYMKTNHTMLFSFFTILGVFLSFYFGKFELKFLNKNIILLIIEQIGFVLLLLNLNLQCSISNLSGYICSIEERINYLANEKICQWESIMVPQHFFNFKKLSGTAVSSVILSLVLLFSFLLFAYNVIVLFEGYYIIILHIVESILLLYILSLALKDRKRSYELTKI